RGNALPTLFPSPTLFRSYIGGQLQMLPHVTFVEPDDERLKARVQVVGKLPPDARTGQGVIAKVVGYPATPGEPLLVSVIESFERSEEHTSELQSQSNLVC